MTPFRETLADRPSAEGPPVPVPPVPEPAAPGPPVPGPPAPVRSMSAQAAAPASSAASAGLAATFRRTAVPLAVLGGAVAAFGCVAAVDPNSPGRYPVCPLLHYTGFYCPGCGGLRSAYAVAHGQFGTALGCNALAVAGYAVFAVVWAVWFWRTLRGRSFEPVLSRGRRWVFWSLLLGFGVVRNLPFGAALAP